MPKNYFWLKLDDKFILDKPVKRLRKYAGGDTYLIIYIKLLSLSIRSEGTLHYQGIEENFAEELSLEIDESQESINFVLNFLSKWKLIEEGVMTENGQEYHLIYAVNNIGSETDSAKRVRKHRENKAKQKALQCNENLLQGNNEVTEEKQEVTQRREEKRREEKEKKRKEYCDSNESLPKIDYQNIMNVFNAICRELPKIKSMTDTRKKTIKRIINKEPEFSFEDFFKKVAETPFLNGHNNKNWSANFDWILKLENRIKIQEDTYKSNKQQSNQNNKPAQACNYEQRQYDDEYFNSLYSDLKSVK